MKKDYWPIMKILTAYVRKNSSVDSRLKESSMAIKAIPWIFKLMKVQIKHIQKY